MVWGGDHGAMRRERGIEMQGHKHRASAGIRHGRVRKRRRREVGRMEELKCCMGSEADCSVWGVN